MSRWQNSKVLTARTYDLVRAEPHLKRWSIRAGVWGLLVGALGVVPGIALLVVGGAAEDVAADGTAVATGGLGLAITGAVLVFIGMVAGNVAANLQLAALVSAADEVLAGRTPDDAACRSAARSRLGALIGWGVISAIVGLVVGAIRGDGDSGIASAILRSLAAGVVAAAWAVITFFALPVIVLDKVGAGAAIKRSAGLVRSTWGETIGGSVRIGARFGLMFTLPGVLLLAGGIVLAIAVGGPAVAAAAVLVIIGLGLMLWGAVLMSTCRNVFGVALYRWATGGGALGPYSEDDLRGAVRTGR